MISRLADFSKCYIWAFFLFGRFWVLDSAVSTYFTGLLMLLQMLHCYAKTTQNVT